jgi:hypothetical protein
LEAIDDSPDSLSEASVSKRRAASSTASPPTQPVVRRGRPAALSDARDGRHLSDTSGRGQLRRVQGGYRVESLISRICGSSPRERPFHIAPSAPQELLSAINPFEFACANRVRNGRSDVASSNSARLHVGSTGRFWRKAVGKAGSWQNFPRWLNLAQTSP